MSLPTIRRLIALLSITILTTGCQKPDGPVRYDVSGSVTLDGKPVQAGEIKFEPDSSQGNAGPGVTVQITSGKYATISGKGLIGGPHVVILTAYDGIPIESKSGEGNFTSGKFLLKKPYQTQTDFPKATSTQNYEIPASEIAK